MYHSDAVWKQREHQRFICTVCTCKHSCQQQNLHQIDTTAITNNKKMSLWEEVLETKRQERLHVNTQQSCEAATQRALKSQFLLTYCDIWITSYKLLSELSNFWGTCLPSLPDAWRTPREQFPSVKLQIGYVDEKMSSRANYEKNGEKRRYFQFWGNYSFKA